MKPMMLCAVALWGCVPLESQGGLGAPVSVEPVTVQPVNGATSPPGPSLEQRRAQLSREGMVAYVRRLAPLVVGRTLRVDEAATLTSGAALTALMNQWTGEVGFSKTAREWISTKLKASGTRGAINLELPGNLAEYVTSKRLPHSALLTADFCVNDAGEKIPCDTGAPFTAGVLTTRAYLSNNAGRYNLKRARALLRTFACQDYPLSVSQQPRLERNELIDLFSQDQHEGDSVGSFGNGFACYTCHSQFGAHAQPFVKFNDQGQWVAGADGQQLVGGEQGKSTNGLFASHLASAESARKETSQVFGRPVENLAGVAQSYTQSTQFWNCSVNAFLGFVFGLSDSAVFAMPVDVTEEIVAEATAKEPQPSLAALATAALSHPAVVRSFEVSP
jgi:hypothetical protein